MDTSDIFDKKTQIKESELKIETVPVTVKLIKAYCPKCGKEIISDTPIMFNPFTKQKICMYKCECGYEENIEYAYPRVVFVDDNNNEYEAYAK